MKRIALILAAAALTTAQANANGLAGFGEAINGFNAGRQQQQQQQAQQPEWRIGMVVAFRSSGPERVTTVSGRDGVRCSYTYHGQTISRIFLGAGCPEYLEVQ